MTDVQPERWPTQGQALTPFFSIPSVLHDHTTSLLSPSIQVLIVMTPHLTWMMMPSIYAVVVFLLSPPDVSHSQHQWTAYSPVLRQVQTSILPPLQLIMY